MDLSEEDRLFEVWEVMRRVKASQTRGFGCHASSEVLFAGGVGHACVTSPSH